jgi:hypothetical protein
MLTTTGFRNFGIEMDGTVNDSTVTFLAGTARVGSRLISWNGMQTQLDTLSSFSGASDTTHFQNVLIYLSQFSTNTGLDMTYTRSVTSPAPIPAEYPAMADFNGYPLSLFTFYSITGSDSTLISYTR